MQFVWGRGSFLFFILSLPHVLFNTFSKVFRISQRITGEGIPFAVGAVQKAHLDCHVISMYGLKATGDEVHLSQLLSGEWDGRYLINSLMLCHR